MSDRPDLSRRPKCRPALVAFAAAAMLVSGIVPGTGRAEPPQAAADPLKQAFRDPPASARPRVWWHWMNGNITTDGIARDLDWMKRIGIGGLQNFDVTQDTPQIVDKRLVYMSPDWKNAFRFAVEHADSLGLEYGIAASPGWSETGGPWVEPEHAMKKLVWSEAVVTGGKRFTGTLAAPPDITGPYQGVARTGQLAPAAPARFYRDVAVLAYPMKAGAALPVPVRVTANGVPVADGVLRDDDPATGIALPQSTAAGPGVIAIDYGRPQTIRSLRLFVLNLPARSFTGPLAPRLEASDDGATWRRISDIALMPLPTTSSFAPVTARYFRVRFLRGKMPDTSSFAPAAGIDLSAMGGLGGGPAPAPLLSELRLSPDARVNAAEQKAVFALADDYYALDGDAGPDVAGVPASMVVDLTGKMTSDGKLEWTPPPGRWTVLRLGYSLTGAVNSPATTEATGLETDKYDAPSVERYLTTYLQQYHDVTGDALFGKHGVSTLVTDSIETGPSNWTPRLLAQFRRLRGYDALPWLPTLTGAIIGSRRQSDAFLYDFRRTLADLIASEHYGTVARVAHADGLTLYGESLEGGRTISSIGDDLDMRRFADVPMAAMWAYGKAPAPSLVADMRGAASIAHLYGRPFVAAESLTSILEPWAYAPSDLQPMIDAEFLAGINRPVIHSVVHQPVEGKTPGLALGIFGQYFGRNETWAEMARPWIDYIARTSYLLQQGRNVADVAYFYGEEAPVAVQALNGGVRDVPARYGYDFVSATGLIDELSVDGGALVSKGGARYRALYLGGTSARMTMPVLRRIARLAEAGATIIGAAPTATPSLADDPAEFAALVGRLWTGGAVTRIGAGQVMTGEVEAGLALAGIAPDVATVDGHADPDLAFVHRQLEDGDLYFVSNRTARPQSVELRFRVTGKAPMLWHADTGASEAVSYRIDKSSTLVPLDLDAGQSVFVVFRDAAPAASRVVARPGFATVGELGGPWAVSFQPGRGAPVATTMQTLAPLSANDDAGIRYFSGTATYTKEFAVPGGARRRTLLLDLGRVGDVAEVRVNGRPAGIAWKAPYRIDIGALVRPGRNQLEVRVADLWVNRLIGDRQPGATKITYTTIPTYVARAPLRPSGLIGPVRLLTPSGDDTAARK